MAVAQILFVVFVVFYYYSSGKFTYFSSLLQILKEKKHLSPLTFHFSLFTLHSLSPHIIYYYQMENVLMKGFASVPASRCGLCIPRPATPPRQPRTPPSRAFHHYRKYRPNASKLPNTGIKYNHSRSLPRLFVQSLITAQDLSLFAHFYFTAILSRFCPLGAYFPVLMKNTFVEGDDCLLSRRWMLAYKSRERGQSSTGAAVIHQYIFIKTPLTHYP